ncbi:repetitive organellar protein-like isoform X1 [Hydra vulgaris]|uniref:repetitive organellar protein-like isoform X1 n=1 Tax=Hydra vulgaris TaxID=6087 RepID=UPI0032EA3514
MLTPRSETSQDDIQKIGAVFEEDSESRNINEENKFSTKFDLLILELKRLVEVYTDERKLVNGISSLIKLCNELSFEFEQRRKNDADRYKKNLKEIDLKLHTLESNNKNYIIQIDSLIKENQNIQNTNETLNKYIHDAEISQIREIGSLKAKMSLMRIEKEIEYENEMENSIVTSKVKTKKKSFPAFFRKKQPKKIDIINLAEHLVEKNEEKLKLEMENMSIEIESLKKSCEDFQKREELLESELLSKDIEISRKQKRIKELNEKCLQNKNFNIDCQQLIKAAELKINRTKCIVRTIEEELKERSCDVSNMRMKVAQLQFCIDTVNEENKKLLSKLNKITFELCNEKIKSNLLFDNLIVFLKIVPNTTAFSPNISCNSTIQVLEEFLKEQIETSKKYISGLIQHNESYNKTRFVETDSQTEVTIRRHTFENDSKVSDISISDSLRETINSRQKRNLKDDRTPSFINNEFITNSNANLHAQEKEIKTQEKISFDKHNKLSTSNLREEYICQHKKTIHADGKNNSNNIKIKKQEVRRRQIEHTLVLKENFDTPDAHIFNCESKSQNSLANREPSRDLQLNQNIIRNCDIIADKSLSAPASKPLRNEVSPHIANVNDLSDFDDSSSIEKNRDLFMQHYKEGTTSIKKILVKKSDFEKCVQLLRSGRKKAV